jgi:hypothetical protein
MSNDDALSDAAGGSGTGTGASSDLYAAGLPLPIPTDGIITGIGNGAAAGVTIPKPVPGKRGGGFSCHCCKTTKKNIDELFLCTNHLPKNNSPASIAAAQAANERALARATSPSAAAAAASTASDHLSESEPAGAAYKRCRKKYCIACMKRLYSAQFMTLRGANADEWSCPSCLNRCTCAGCERKVSGQSEAPWRVRGASGKKSNGKQQHTLRQDSRNSNGNGEEVLSNGRTPPSGKRKLATPARPRSASNCSTNGANSFSPSSKAKQHQRKRSRIESSSSRNGRGGGLLLDGDDDVDDEDYSPRGSSTHLSAAERALHKQVRAEARRRLKAQQRLLDSEEEDDEAEESSGDGDENEEEEVEDEEEEVDEEEPQQHEAGMDAEALDVEIDGVPVSAAVLVNGQHRSSSFARPYPSRLQPSLMRPVLYSGGASELVSDEALFPAELMHPRHAFLLSDGSQANGLVGSGGGGGVVVAPHGSGVVGGGGGVRGLGSSVGGGGLPFQLPITPDTSLTALLSPPVGSQSMEYIPSYPTPEQLQQQQYAATRAAQQQPPHSLFTAAAATAAASVDARQQQQQQQLQHHQQQSQHLGMSLMQMQLCHKSSSSSPSSLKVEPPSSSMMLGRHDIHSVSGLDGSPMPSEGGGISSGLHSSLSSSISSAASTAIVAAGITATVESAADLSLSLPTDVSDQELEALLMEKHRHLQEQQRMTNMLLQQIQSQKAQHKILQQQAAQQAKQHQQKQLHHQQQQQQAHLQLQQQHLQQRQQQQQQAARVSAFTTSVTPPPASQQQPHPHALWLMRQQQQATSQHQRHTSSHQLQLPSFSSSQPLLLHSPIASSLLPVSPLPPPSPLASTGAAPMQLALLPLQHSSHQSQQLEASRLRQLDAQRLAHKQLQQFSPSPQPQSRAHQQQQQPHQPQVHA